MKNLVLSGKLFIALWFIAALLYVPSVDEEAQSYNSLCEFPHMCQADSGKCLCVVGRTGPGTVYIEGNRVLADYCTQPCFYNQFVQSSRCVSTTTTTTTTPTTTTTTTTTRTTPTTTTTTTTRSPSDLLEDLTKQIRDALLFFEQTHNFNSKANKVLQKQSPKCVL